MLTKSIRVKIEGPAGTSAKTQETAERQAHEAAVLAYWQAGEFSTRQAAEELGLSYHEYLDLLAARGIPVEDDTFDAEALEKARQALGHGKP